MKYTEIIKTKFFTLLDLSEAAKKRSAPGLIEKEFEEVILCYNLLAHVVLTTGKRWCIGKILEENHPFDIFMIDEEIYKKTELTKDYSLINPLPIQLKTIRKGKDVQIRITKEEWIGLIQKQIDKVATNVKILSSGVLHLRSLQSVDDMGSEIDALLKGLRFDNHYPYQQVVLSIQIKKENSPSEIEILTWQLYPTFESMACVSVDDNPRLREIYGLR